MAAGERYENYFWAQEQLEASRARLRQLGQELQ